MPQKPLKITKATVSEIMSLGSDPWDFEESYFDGTWWRFEVASDEVQSLIKAFRRQAVRRTGNTIASRRKDGFVFLQVTDKKWTGRKL